MKRLLPLFATAILLSGCSLSNLGSNILGSSVPKAGDTVVVDYVGTEDNGTEFDSSKKEGRTPLEFVI